jgi:hypothetical protein
VASKCCHCKGVGAGGLQCQHLLGQISGIAHIWIVAFLAGNSSTSRRKT